MGPPIIDSVWSLAFYRKSSLKHTDKNSLLMGQHQFCEFALNVSVSPGVMKVQGHPNKNVLAGFKLELLIS